MEYASLESVHGLPSNKARKVNIRWQFDGGNSKLPFFAFFLRVALLLLEGCLGLQPELSVTTCRCWIFGLHIGSRVDFGQYKIMGLLDTM